MIPAHEELNPVGEILQHRQAWGKKSSNMIKRLNYVLSRWNSKARAVRVFRYKRSDWVEEGLSGKKGLGQVVEEQGVWVLS